MKAQNKYSQEETIKIERLIMKNISQHHQRAELKEEKFAESKRNSLESSIYNSSFEDSDGLDGYPTNFTWIRQLLSFL